MHANADIEHDVRNFVIQEFLSGNPAQLSADGSLLGQVIDSTGVLTLVAYLQEHFQIEIRDDEALPSNLDTINSLVAYIARKLNR